MKLITGECKIVKGFDKWQKKSVKTVDNPQATFNLTEEKVLVLNNLDPKEERSFTGRVLGGCMDSIINLIGSPYDNVNNFIDEYMNDGTIWFFEACSLSPIQINKALWQMKNAGWFKNAEGFIFGRPRACFGEIDHGMDQYEAVMSIVSDIGVPVIMDADFGHYNPSIPIINWAIGEVNYKDSNFSVEFELR